MCSVEKLFLKISQNSQKNTCATVSFLNKVVRLRLTTLSKKRLWHRCFPVNFDKFLRTPFFTEHLWWLYLSAKSLINTKTAAIWRCSVRKLKLFGKVTREHTWCSPILVKLQVFSLELYQNSTPSGVFSFEFSENFQNRCLQDTSERLFLLVPVKGFTL